MSILPLCAKQALSIDPMEEARVMNAVVLSSPLPRLPRNPMQEYRPTGKTGPRSPHLHVLLLSRVLGPESGEHPSQAAALASRHVGSRPATRSVPESRASQREGEEALTQHPLSAGTGCKNNSTPCAGTPPGRLASPPICSTKPCRGHQREEESWEVGTCPVGRKQVKDPKHLLEKHSFQGGLCDTGDSSLKNRHKGVRHGFIRDTASGYRSVWGCLE